MYPSNTEHVCQVLVSTCNGVTVKEAPLSEHNVVSASILVEVIKAVHLSSYVQTTFDEGGGLWIVGAPGVLKTTFLKFLESYETALVMSDLNMKKLIRLCGTHLSTRSIRTIVLPELQKLYERDTRTALSVEGCLRGLAEEGWSDASFEDGTINRFSSTATVIGAMTPALRDSCWERWVDTGFTRRFLWVTIRLKHPEILMEAVERATRAQFLNLPEGMNTPTGDIPDLLTREERRALRPLVAHQPKPSNAQYAMLCKVAAVLKWHYKRRGIKRNAISTLKAFAPCLDKAEIDGLTFAGDNNNDGKKENNNNGKAAATGYKSR